MESYFKPAGNLNEDSKRNETFESYFKPAGNLNEDNKKNETFESYFKPAGNLNEDSKKNETFESYFKPAGNLIEDNKKNETFESYFKPAGNLEKNDKGDIIQDINKYLSNVVSGIEYDAECELGTLCSGGTTIVTFEQLQEMVESGIYNIVRAECLNANMISIEFQEYSKNKSRSF